MTVSLIAITSMHSLPNRLPARVSLPSLSTTWSLSLDVSLRSPLRPLVPATLTSSPSVPSRKPEPSRLPSGLYVFRLAVVLRTSRRSYLSFSKSLFSASQSHLRARETETPSTPWPSAPACVVTEKNGISTINKAPKSKQRDPGSMKKWYS